MPWPATRGGWPAGFAVRADRSAVLIYRRMVEGGPMNVTEYPF
jgi:hypothetical protein